MDWFRSREEAVRTVDDKEVKKISLRGAVVHKVCFARVVEMPLHPVRFT